MNNYKDVKNYLHNELGITKEYVDNIIYEVVNKEICKIFSDETYIKNYVKNIIWEEVNKEMVGENSWHTIHDMTSIIKDEINNIIIKEVKNKINISLKEDNNE